MGSETKKGHLQLSVADGRTGVSPEWTLTELSWVVVIGEGQFRGASWRR